MSGQLQNIGKYVSEHPSVSYLTALVLGLFPFLYMMWLNNWSFSALIMAPIMLLPSLLSGVVMRFLSGVGIMLTFATVCSFLFSFASGFVKGSKRRAKAIRILVGVLMLSVGAYPIYKLVGGSTLAGTFGLLEDLGAILGIWSLILSVYIIPAIRARYQPEFDKGFVDELKERVGRIRHSLWKGYQSHIWKEYGKVYAEEFKSYQQSIAEIRNQLSGVLLLPIAIVLLPFPFLMAILVVLWLRTFSLDDEPLKTGERGLLILVSVTVILIETVILLYFVPEAYSFYFNVAYLLGVLLSMVYLGLLIIRS
ncbi:MAG: hypothetical protein GF309_08280 [Candidatus Lokiarchaeota archaeon]|nr:hypothetical protein [Candidatus Lokiarchaeota archaeon]